MEKITRWLLTWFIDNTELLENQISFEKNYIEEEWIDSFEFLELISEIEEKFHLVFTDDDFQNENILTINGLASIVVRRMQNNDK